MTKEREALKLALERLKEWVDHSDCPDDKQAITAIKEVLAQPEQEPVAWMFQHEETGRMMFVEAQQLEWGFEKGNPRLKKIGPVYAIQPKQTWVGLTDEEIQYCVELKNPEAIAEEVEAKLKEKNT